MKRTGLILVLVAIICSAGFAEENLSGEETFANGIIVLLQEDSGLVDKTLQEALVSLDLTYCQPKKLLFFAIAFSFRVKEVF